MGPVEVRPDTDQRRGDRPPIVLQIDLLGPVEARIDGVQIDIGGPRQRAVLAFLAMQANRTVLPERLIDAVWGDDPPASARSTLQAYVSRLRKTLARVGHDLIERDTVGYVLRLPAHALDVDRMRELAEDGRRAILVGVPETAAARFAEALQQQQGEPLADLLDYEFARTEQQRLADELRTVAGEWIDAELASGNHQRVVSEVERLLEDAPFHEPHWERLMLALYRSDRQADALAAYQAARRILKEELGLEPGPALADTEAAILRHDESLKVSSRGNIADIAPGERPDLGQRSEYGLVGRDDALAEINHLLGALGSGGSVAVVSGPAGIGKTAVLAVAAQHAVALGAIVLQGRAWEDDVAPAFWPWIEALRELTAAIGLDRMKELASAHLDHLLPLLPELSPPTDNDAGRNRSMAQFAIYEAVANVLLNAAQDRDIVIVLDDLHWADAASIEVLRLIAPRAVGARLLVLAGCRSPAMMTDSTELAWLALETSSLTMEIQLDELSPSATKTLVEQHAPSGSSSETIDEVVRRSDGVPLFACELARETSSRGHSRVPASLAQAIRRRVDKLEPTTTQLLQVAAVAGQEFSLHTVGPAAEQRGVDLLTSVETGIDAGLIAPVSHRPAFYHFNHALVRDALAESLSPIMRATIHDRLAEAIGSFARPGTIQYVLERAHHALEAGAANPNPTAVKLALEAADHSLRSAGYEDAIGWLTRAEHMATACGDRVLWADVLLRRGEVENLAGWVERAEQTHLAVADFGRELGDGAVMARAAVGYAFTRIDIQNVDEIHLGLCAEADEMLDAADSTDRARLLASWGPAHYWHDVELSRSLTREAIAMARRLGDSGVLGSALQASGWTASGGALDRIELGHELLEIARRDRDTELELWGHRWTYVGVFDAEGQSQRSRAALATYVERAEHAKQPHHQWFSEMFLANEEMRHGRISAAEPLIESAFIHGQKAEPISATYYYGAQLFNLRWLQGRIDELTPLAEVTVAQVPNIHTWRALLAYLYACEGATDRAEQLLRELQAVGWDDIGSGGTLIMSHALVSETAVLTGNVEIGSDLVNHMNSHADRYVHMATVTTMGCAPFFQGRLLGLTGDVDGAIGKVRRALEMDDLGRLEPLVVRDQLVLAGLLDKRGMPGDDVQAAELRRASSTVINGATSGSFNYL